MAVDRRASPFAGMRSSSPVRRRCPTGARRSSARWAVPARVPAYMHGEIAAAPTQIVGPTQYSCSRLMSPNQTQPTDAVDTAELELPAPAEPPARRSPAGPPELGARGRRLQLAQPAAAVADAAVGAREPEDGRDLRGRSQRSEVIARRLLTAALQWSTLARGGTPAVRPRQELARSLCGHPLRMDSGTADQAAASVRSARAGRCATGRRACRRRVPRGSRPSSQYVVLLRDLPDGAALSGRHRRTALAGREWLDAVARDMARPRAGGGELLACAAARRCAAQPRAGSAP